MNNRDIKHITDITQKLVNIVEQAKNICWVTSLDVNKTTTKENLVVMNTKTTYNHLANRESAKDNKGKYYYSPINNSPDRKHTNAFAIVFPDTKCNSDTNIHTDGNKKTSQLQTGNQIVTPKTVSLSARPACIMSGP